MISAIQIGYCQTADTDMPIRIYADVDGEVHACDISVEMARKIINHLSNAVAAVRLTNETIRVRN